MIPTLLLRTKYTAQGQNECPLFEIHEYHQSDVVCSNCNIEHLSLAANHSCNQFHMALLRIQNSIQRQIEHSRVSEAHVESAAR